MNLKGTFIIIGIAVTTFIVVALALNNLIPKTAINSLIPSSYSNLDNSLYGFGSNFAGQLGQENILKSPVLLQSIGADNIIKYDTGNKHTVVLTADNQVFQYGSNGINGESNQRYIEVNKDGNIQKLSNIVDISAGSDYSLALDSDGNVWAWGNNLTAQLGQGNNTESTFALKINNLKEIVQVSAGYKFGLALDKYGQVWGWGGSCSEERKKAAEAWLSTPKTVPGIGGYYDPTSLGSQDNINNQSEDYNSYCANEDVIGFSSKTPIRIEGLNSITKISAGWGHTLAIDVNEDVWSFGCNLYDQVSTTPDHMKPYKIPQLKNIKEVSAGYRHSLALSSTGKVYAWGYNLRGALGTGENSATEKVPQELKFINAVQISAAHDYSAVLDNQGQLYLFGENNSGIITKDLNQISTPNPTRIYSDRKFASFSAGKNFVLALINK